MMNQFSDIIDVPSLQDLMDSLCRITGIPVAILDQNGLPFLSSCWPKICETFHQLYPEQPRRCFPLDAFTGATDCQPVANGWVEFKCQNGLIGFGFPVRIEGQHVATLLVGPLLHKPVDPTIFIARAAELGIQKDEYLHMAEQVSVIAREKIEDSLDFYSSLVKILTDTALQSILHQHSRQEAERSESRFRDLTERKKSAMVLRESEKRFGGIFEEAGVGMVLTQKDGQFAQVNPEFCRFLGYTREELLTKTVEEITFPEDRPESMRKIREALAGERTVINIEKRYLHKGGYTVWGRTTAVYKLSGIDSHLASVAMVQDITSEKLAQEAAQASEATLKSILMAAPVGAGVVRKRVMTLVNLWMIEELGYAEDELIGQSARMLYASTAEFDRVGLEQYSQLSREVVGETQTLFKRKDGKLIDVLLRWVPIDPEDFDAGIIFTAADISAMIRVEKELRNALDETKTAHYHLNAILHSVTAGLIVIDQTGLIMMINPATEVLLDLKAGEVIGIPVAEIIADPEFLDGIRCTLAGGDRPAPIQLNLDNAPESKNIYLQIKVAPLKEIRGDVHGAVVILHDVTREHEINQMKDEFISTAAHELRTPMTSILGYTELMLEQIEQFEIGQLQEFLQIICDRSLALSQIISDMLDLSRVQSGRLVSLEKFSGNLVELVRQILPSYKYNDNQCKVIIDVDEGFPRVLFDPYKMTQVFDNLISNAVKFSPDGGTINVVLKTTPDGIVVAIEDQGLGMSPEQQERVFDKFYRADSSNTAVSGLGLGMSLVKSIIEGHGGRIWVKSEVRVGTIVYFTLPGMLRNNGELT